MFVFPVNDNDGTIAIDWHTQSYHGQSVLVILHGWTDGSDNAYVRWMVLAPYSKLKVGCVIAHAQGCDQSQLTSRTFCDVKTDDLRVSIKYIHSIAGNKMSLFAVDYSLGDGVLTKYLGEESSLRSFDG